MSLSLSKCKKGKRNVYITSTWYLLYRMDDWTDRHWRRNYLILVSLDEAYENDIDWPTEIILAKLTKWLEINIFVKLTQMLKTCVFTSFHKRGKRSTYQRTQLKSLCLTRRIKTSLYIYIQQSFFYIRIIKRRKHVAMINKHSIKPVHFYH